MLRASQRVTARYNLRRRHEQFVVGQEVYRKRYSLSDAARYYSAELAPEYVGPFIISKRVSPYTYEMKDRDGRLRSIWNAKDLKEFFDNNDP